MKRSRKSSDSDDRIGAIPQGVATMSPEQQAAAMQAAQSEMIAFVRERTAPEAWSEMEQAQIGRAHV